MRTIHIMYICICIRDFLVLFETHNSKLKQKGATYMYTMYTVYESINILVHMD